MFHLDWSDSQALWLNITNLSLGIVTLLALALVGVSLAQEWIARRRGAREVDGLDAEISHMLHVPELGMTMADGGEPKKNNTRK